MLLHLETLPPLFTCIKDLPIQLFVPVNFRSTRVLVHHSTAINERKTPSTLTSFIQNLFHAMIVVMFSCFSMQLLLHNIVHAFVFPQSSQLHTILLKCKYTSVFFAFLCVLVLKSNERKCKTSRQDAVFLIFDAFSPKITLSKVCT